MDHSIIDIWDAITQELREKLPKPAFETFRNACKPISFVNNELTIGVPTIFSRNWFVDRCEHFSKHIVANRFGFDIQLHTKIIEEQQKEMDHEIDQLREASAHVVQQSLPYVSRYVNSPSLNEKYSFDNFVVGHFNRFSYSATVAVSKSPGKAYNPLFIYGGVGLGKTHLLHAAGNQIKKAFPKMNVLYVAAEKFTNDLIQSIQDNKMPEFREKYRTMDVLMIDDIQFLAGKGRTEEEFFHTFNTLYEHNKQIVISSDRPAKEFTDIEERLKSRFDWGLSADIQPPDLETRIAILRSKALKDNMELPPEVVHYIASQIISNIRELEGCLIRIIAYASLVHQEITIALAKDVIKDIVRNASSKIVSVLAIKKAVSVYFSMDINDLSAKTRTKDIAHSRQIAMFLTREMTNLSLPKIGENFGGRDHTTVMHACDKIKEEIFSNTNFKYTLEQIKKAITENG